MIHDKKEFGLGLALMAGFLVVLAVIFMPLFEGGRNTIDYLDNVFNSISKNSAYYIPELGKKAAAHVDKNISLKIKASDEAQAGRMEKLLAQAGASVDRAGAELAISADLGKLLGVTLADADLLFKNDRAALQGKYDVEARRTGFDWHRMLGAAAKELDRQQLFAESKAMRDVMTKGVEPAYNYFGVQAVPMKDLLWVVLAALVGYVVYTVWYGYAILFLFEGWGLRLEH
jgi:hypothetical protein